MFLENASSFSCSSFSCLQQQQQSYPYHNKMMTNQTANSPSKSNGDSFLDNMLEMALPENFGMPQAISDFHFHPENRNNNNNNNHLAPCLPQQSLNNTLDKSTNDPFFENLTWQVLSGLNNSLPDHLDCEEAFDDDIFEPAPIVAPRVVASKNPSNNDDSSSSSSYSSSSSSSSESSKKKREFELEFKVQAGCSAAQPSKKQRLEDNQSPVMIHFEDPIPTRFRDYQAEQWTEKFEELCEFVKKHGHCQVPHGYDKNKSLSRWLKRQRYQYKLKNEGKPSTMTNDRIAALNALGFVWNSHCAVWEERLTELLEFKQQHGHCNVPSQFEENQKLATWVKCQRRQYKLFLAGDRSNMTIERVNRLQRIGFVWELRCHPPKQS